MIVDSRNLSWLVACACLENGHVFVMHFRLLGEDRTCHSHYQRHQQYHQLLREYQRGMRRHGYRYPHPPE
jgi:hypothetical protein